MQIDQKRLQYCQEHSAALSPVLQELERQTYLRTLHPQMLSGPHQGLFLKMISQMLQPRRILEIGTFTGYSAICLAQGLADGGRLYTIEANDELLPIAREYIGKAGLADKIVLMNGDAAALIPPLDGPFDLVFLDAGKLDYTAHYALTLPKLRPGGFLLADNVLWDNKVLSDDPDPTTQALREFNRLVHTDDRVENLLLPLRDGLMLVRKR